LLILSGTSTGKRPKTGEYDLNFNPFNPTGENRHVLLNLNSISRFRIPSTIELASIDYAILVALGDHHQKADDVAARLYIFLNEIRDIYQDMMIGWHVTFPFRWGADCALISGTLAGLETPYTYYTQIRHKTIPGSRLAEAMKHDDAFSLIVRRHGERLGEFGCPMVIDVHRRYSGVDLRARSIRLADLSFISNTAIYTLVDFRIQAMSRTILSLANIRQPRVLQVSLPPNFVHELDRLVHSQNADATAFADAASFILHELDNMISPDQVYQLNEYEQHISRRLAGILPILSVDERAAFQVFVLSKNEDGQGVKFLIKPLSDERYKMCVNIVEGHENRDLAVTLDSQRPTIEKLIELDTIVFNIFLSFQHSADAFEVQELAESRSDYISREVVVTCGQYDDMFERYTPQALGSTNVAVATRDFFVNGQPLEHLLDSMWRPVNTLGPLISNNHHLRAIVEGFFHYTRRFTDVLTIDAHFSCLTEMIHVPKVVGYANFRGTTLPILLNFASHERAGVAERSVYQGLALIGQVFRESGSQGILNIVRDQETGNFRSRAFYLGSEEQFRPRSGTYAVCSGGGGAERKKRNVGFCRSWMQKATADSVRAEVAEPESSRVSKTDRSPTGVNQLADRVYLGFISRDLAGDLVREDYKNFTHDLGGLILIVGGGAVGSALISSGLEKFRTGRYYTAETPKLTATGVTSGIIVGISLYDMTKRLEALEKGQDQSVENRVNIAFDGMNVGAFGTKSVAATTDLIELTEEASVLVDPYAEAVAVTAIIGQNIYTSVNSVYNIGENIDLSEYDEAHEFLRSFFHLGLDQKMQEKLDRAGMLNNVVQKMARYIEKSPVKEYYVPIPQLSCYLNPETTQSNTCQSSPMKINRRTQHTILRSAKIDVHINEAKLICQPGTAYRKRRFLDHVKWPPLQSDLPMRTPLNDLMSTVESYECQNALGLRDELAEHSSAYYLLGSGKDEVVADRKTVNIYAAQSGHKNILGGDIEDVFFISSANVTGNFDGQQGYDVVDFSRAPHSDNNALKIKVTRDFSSASDRAINLRKVEHIIGRENAPDHIVEETCRVTHFDLKGGARRNHDKISFPNVSCYRNVNVNISGGYLTVDNSADRGEFTYFSQKTNNLTVTVLNILNDKSRHEVIFDDMGFENLDEVVIRKHSRHLMHALEVSIRFSNGAVLNINSNCYEIDCSVKFRDGVKFSASSQTATLNSSLSEKELLEKYFDLVTKSGIALIAFSQTDQKTITIGHDIKIRGDKLQRLNIVTNNPESKNDLTCGNGENVFVIRAKADQPCFEDVVINCSSEPTSLKTIYIKHLFEKFEAMQVHLENRFNTSIDIVLSVNETETGRITLRNALVNDSFRQFIVHDRIRHIFRRRNHRQNFTDTQLPELRPQKHKFKQSNVIFIRPDHIYENTTLQIYRQLLSHEYFRKGSTLVLTNFLTTMLYDWANTVFVVMVAFFENRRIFNSLRLAFMAEASATKSMLMETEHVFIDAARPFGDFVLEAMAIRNFANHF